jgi:hypothetical protein
MSENRDLIDYWSGIAQGLKIENQDLLSRLDQVTEERDGLEKDLKLVHDRLLEKYEAAKRNLENHADKCGGKDRIEGYMSGLIDGMALTGKSGSVCMQPQALKGKCKTCGGSGKVWGCGEDFVSNAIPCPDCKEEEKKT